MRIRLRALLTLADELALYVDAYLAALLDIRPVASWGTQALAWLVATWRRHVVHARWRAHGPGRGVLSMTLAPQTDRKATSDDR